MLKDMKTLNDLISKQLQDNEFRKEYESIQTELNAIRAGADTVASHDMKLKELDFDQGGSF